MTIEVTHVRFGGQQRTYEAIAHYKWRNRENGTTNSSAKPALVAAVDGGTLAYVGSGAQQVRVVAVHPLGSLPYLRTSADQTGSNNLLSLPTF